MHEVPRRELTIFISHSSADSSLAQALVELLEKALKVPARQIRCTSVDGYKLPVGADTDQRLKREIFGARAFIGVITPSSARSAYVLFELGARWGADRHFAPVLAAGADESYLSGPLTGINALFLTARNQVWQLVQDVAEHLELSLEPMSSFQTAVDHVVAVAKTPAIQTQPQATEAKDELSDDEIRVLQYLASVTDETTAELVAEHMNIAQQKAWYFLTALEEKGMAYSSPVVYGVTTVGITQDGRTALVRRQLL